MAVTAFAAAIALHNMQVSLLFSDTATTAATVGDCWYQIFSGIPEYIYTESGKFELPIFWMLLHAYLFFVVASYPADDLKGMGLKSMILGKSRIKWAAGKICWTMAAVVCYYALLFLNLCVFAYAGQSGSITLGGSTETVNIGIKTLYLLPLAADTAIALMQMLLASIVKPSVAYIFTVGYLVLGAYWKRNFLIGNFAMLLRNSQIVRQGLDSGRGFLYCAFFGITSIIFYLMYIRRKDIF